MRYIFTLLGLMFTFNFSFAQTIDATLVELNFHEDSYPQNLTSFQGGFYFTATDGYYGNFGRELWYTDGTHEGTIMIKDIKSGQNSSNPSSLVVVGQTLFFTADDGIAGTELWKSDGTESGTMMVKDIQPDNNTNYDEPTNLIALNGILYFTATNSTDGYELWRSDGTETGTFLIKDINPNGPSSPSDLFVFNNRLYFAANDGTNGIELWKSDGTEAGTLMVKNINTNNSALYNGNQFIILNSFFYFFAYDGTNGCGLWKSNGTESGTTMVKDIAAGYSSSTNSLKGSILNNLIIFEANDGINGTEIWKSDGTENGTSMIKDINNSSNNSLSSDNVFIEYNSEVYFIANDNIHGSEVWKTDGTPDGTILLKDINDGYSSISIKKFHVDHINNKLLFFTTSTDSFDRTLWGSDGSANGTFGLADIRVSNILGLDESFITFNNYTVFSGEDGIYGNELWMTDGTTSGTSIFADMNYSNSSTPSKFTNVNGILFFCARGLEDGNQLYKSDGTSIGTQLVKDINPGSNGIDDNGIMKIVNNTLYFNALDGIHGYELWKSDGTESGTVMIKDINPGSQSGMLNYDNANEFTDINNILYFSADDGVHGIELWRSDGTEAGTYMIKDLRDGDSNSDSYPKYFVQLNDMIYFISFDDTGTALWKTDGTESGTLKIINLNDMQILKAVNNNLIIIAETSGTTYGPHDLWVSDGTSVGTSHIKSYGDNIDSSIKFTTCLNNELYFVAIDPVSGRQGVFKTDGTIDNTNQIFDGATHPTFSNVDINNIISCGEYVYFGVSDTPISDRELWRSNGTTTEKIAGSDIEIYFFIRNLTCYNSNLLYIVEAYPNKIWITNGNLNEPIKLDINIVNGPNLESYNSIEDLGVSANNLYFRARNDISGGELYITHINSSELGIIEQNGSCNLDSKLVNIFPNPANEFIYFMSKNNSKIVKFELFDLSGNKIHIQLNKDLKKEIIYDVSNLSTGIYFVSLTLSDGKTDNQKLIINH